MFCFFFFPNIGQPLSRRLSYIILYDHKKRHRYNDQSAVASALYMYITHIFDNKHSRALHRDTISN